MEESEVASADHAGLTLSLQGNVDFSSMFGVSQRLVYCTLVRLGRSLFMLLRVVTSQMDTARLFGGVQARCVAMHPRQATVAVVRLLPVESEPISVSFVVTVCRAVTCINLCSRRP